MNIAMRYERAIIGSANKAKIIGAARALRLVGIREVLHMDIDGSKPQPIGFEEMIEGAEYRALKAVEKYPGSLGVGIEAGIVGLKGYGLSGQVAIVTDGNYYSLGTSMFFPLPGRVWDEIMRGESIELRDALQKHYNLGGLSNTIGAIGHYTKGYVTRIELSFQAVLSALLPWLNPEYGDLRELNGIIWKH